MLGWFRLALAVVVVVFHVGFYPFGLQIGASAVTAFYMVSGYAMSALWRCWYGEGHVTVFYFDRLLRLYPQYVVFCSASAVLVFGFGIKLGSFQIGEPSWVTVVAHTSLLPLTFGALTPTISQFTLVPQAWSLGTELIFYLLFPAIQSRIVLATTILTSLTVFAVASTGQIISPTSWAFYLPPGCLFIFLIGTLIQRADQTLLTGTMGLYAAIVGSLLASGKMSIGYNRELLIGIVVGFVAVSILAKRKAGALDTLLGDLSYGVYLSHMVVFAIVNYMGWFGDNFIARATAVTGVSMVAAAASLRFIERPITRYRKRLRARSPADETKRLFLVSNWK
jgi:peptidoglycan/LPS O-acetylase OafA/YrhL